jgi:hypothetical protein
MKDAYWVFLTCELSSVRQLCRGEDIQSLIYNDEAGRFGRYGITCIFANQIQVTAYQYQPVVKHSGAIFTENKSSELEWSTYVNS